MKMHWVTAKVNLSGQGYTIVVIGNNEPLSWPEAQVLMALHGGENIYDVKPCAISIVEPRSEKARLFAKYGRIVEQVFPGYMPRMEMLMPGEPEDQPLAANDEGKPLGVGEVLAEANGNGDPKPGPAPDDDDDEGDDSAKGPIDPPTGPAVFKPGKHQPPRKEA